ncbi:ParD-like family protein [Pseudoalteromonas sp. JBTF-M23]|uniref:ParD-like family protein n=1 Tax=Pseudoalteromonas caenipelagi TaxID=2726988 RepID=A0A849V7M0_9GAMM|nr:ParD-like family protein [Pseudoalteromonas caenipelagi]NOU49332.1 ParD-like family protein [Pseudoalteromonas caenipelagi]
MGIVKISDELHEELRATCQVMSRSINSQAEFWIKMGRLAELNPDKTFTQLIQAELAQHTNQIPAASTKNE